VVTHHEYGHIADLEDVSGLSKTLRSIFGHIITPAIQEPTILIEGIADYGEYLMDGFSRSNEERVSMMLRAMILENKFPNYQQASFFYNRTEWPFPGSIAHDMGPWFVNYLEDKYGKDTYAKLKKLQVEDPLWAIGSLLAPVPGGSGLTGDFGSLFKKVTGKSMEVIWEEFQTWLQAQFNEQIQDIEAKGISPSRRVSQLGYGSGNGHWSPDAQWIYYNHNGSPGRFGGIRRIHPDGTGDEAVVSPAGNFDITPDGKSLVYIKNEIYNNSYQRLDLYRFDLDARTETRLTHGERSFAPAITPDGSSVIYARYNWGQKTPSISRYDFSTGKITPIQDFPDDFAVESLTLSPDGKTLALSIYRRGGYSDIYTLPATGGQLTAITQDKPTDYGQRFSPDGQYLFFSSDRTGVYNLYAYHISDGKFSQVSNMLTGALGPNISPAGDKQIAFTGYSAAGYDLNIMRYEPNTWKEATITKETIPDWKGFPTTNYAIHDYSPIPSLIPKLWQPQISTDSLGASTFGQDALYQQFYNLSGGWDLKASKPFINFNYFYSGILPTITIFGGINPGGNFEGLSVGYPLVASNNHGQNISVSYQRSDFGKVSETYSANWSLNELSGLDLVGHAITLTMTGSLNRTAGADPVRKVVTNATHTFFLPWYGNSIANRFVFGWSDAGTPEKGFNVGGQDGLFMVRGVGAGAATGQMAMAASMEYRFPIASIEKGISLWPIFLDKLTGDIFVDAGYAGFDPAPKYFEDLKIGYGVELELSLNLFSYFGGPVIRFGAAQGLGQTSPTFYISSGTAF
jgi:Tol biopolymer transport system component